MIKKKTTMRACMYGCLIGLLTACGQGKESNEKSQVTVKTVQVSQESTPNNREFTFISKPIKRTELSFRVGGPIDQFEVYAGTHYKRGQLIAQIDPRDFRIRKERTEAIYLQTKAEFERIQTLYEKNNLSASAYEKARADYASAKAAFDTATNELNDTRLVAPFNGYVGEVYIEKFQDVKPSEPIISFIDMDELKIETYVTQDIAFGIHKPAEIALRFDANPSQTYLAKVLEVSKSTMQNNLSYLLTAVLPNKDGALLGGMSGKVMFNIETANEPDVLSIPQKGLSHRPTEGNYVWVIDTATNQASKRLVTVGDLLPNGRIIIKEGLSSNETIAVSGLRFLSDGVSVTIATEVK